MSGVEVTMAGARIRGAARTRWSALALSHSSPSMGNTLQRRWRQLRGNEAIGG